ncbi:MAG: hypothetical protein AAGB34_09205 [Planctomycetota bacterium]
MFIDMRGIASASVVVALATSASAAFTPLVEVEPNDSLAEAMTFDFLDFTDGAIAVDGSVTSTFADDTVDPFDWYAVDLFALDQLTVSIFSIDSDAAFTAFVFTAAPGTDSFPTVTEEADGAAASVGDDLLPLATFPTPFGDFEVREFSFDFVAEADTTAYILVVGELPTATVPSPIDPASYKLVLGYNPGPNVPTPGSMALVAMAGLAAIRRSR